MEMIRTRNDKYFGITTLLLSSLAVLVLYLTPVCMDWLFPKSKKTMSVIVMSCTPLQNRSERFMVTVVDGAHKKHYCMSNYQCMAGDTVFVEYIKDKHDVQYTIISTK